MLVVLTPHPGNHTSNFSLLLIIKIYLSTVKVCIKTKQLDFTIKNGEHHWEIGECLVNLHKSYSADKKNATILLEFPWQIFDKKSN